MGSKIFILLGLSISFALLISSEVAARNLAETTTKTEGASLDRSYHNGYKKDYEPPYLPNPGYAPVVVPNPGGGGVCPYTCYGRCCSAAEAKALEASTQVKPHN